MSLDHYSQQIFLFLVFWVENYNSAQFLWLPAQNLVFMKSAYTFIITLAISAPMVSSHLLTVLCT